MTRRRTPVETAFTSTVAYPSALFSLEKDEVFPYERFAYNLLNEAVHALHSKGLPERIFVDFERPLQGLYPWSINSTISFELDDKKQPTAFHFVTPELVPAILYLYSAVVLSEFNGNDDTDKSQSGPEILVHQIHRFVDAANAGIRGYLESGFGKAVRSSYEQCELEIWDLDKAAHHFDLITKLIANHEIAHAYVKQITRQPKPSGTEIVAFEFLADLVATDWFFTKMIGNTPDTEVYRKYRGMNSYAETILANSVAAQRSQFGLLMLMAIAGAQRTKGQATLSGGESHPHGLQRFLLQHWQLYTLIRSNFTSILSQDDIRMIELDWDTRLTVFKQCGIVQASDSEILLDKAEWDAVGETANLIEELRIVELEPLVPLLREIRDRRVAD